MATAPVTCRKCDAAIPPEDVNVAEGAAFCRACGSLNRLRDILEDAPLAKTDVQILPSGCAILDDGLHTTVRASMRSLGSSAGVFLFVGFWISIVSIFVLIAIADTLRYFFGTVPSWFPTPPQGGSSGSGGPVFGASLGSLIFMWVFLTPFIAVGLGGILVLLTTLFGRVEVRLRDIEGAAFVGFGPFGWRRRFDATAVKSVRLGETTWKQNEQTKQVIVIDADRVIRMGSMLPDERRNWMAATLRKLLVH